MPFKPFYKLCDRSIIANLLILGFLLVLLCPQTVTADEAKLNFYQAEIGYPCPSIPYYHFKIQIEAGEKTPFQIIKIIANGSQIHHYEIRDLSWKDEPDKVFHYNWPPFAISRFGDFVYEKPFLIARLDWQSGKRYEIEISYSFKDNPKVETIKQEISAPDEGGYWDVRWKYYKSVVISEDFGLERQNEPVRFSLIFYTDQITDLNRELRMVQIDGQGKATMLLAQVYDIQEFLKEDKPRYGQDGELRPFYWLPSVYAKIIVPVSVKANSNVVLLAFYGNPNAEKLKSESPLKVQGNGLALAIENDYYKVKLHPKSGMLDEITLKSKPEITLLHKLETNGAIHWNPGAYSPRRPWMHASDWDPPEHYDTSSGPVMFTLHRRGFMPNMPEIALGITYKFFANSPYFFMSSTLEIVKDVPVQAFRNAEIVFDHKFIDKAAWQDPAAAEPEHIDLYSIPNLTEIHLPLDVSWLSFLNSEKQLGFAGIPVGFANASLNDEPLEYNPYLYITKGPWVYWTRVLATPYMTQNMQQIVTVPEGNIYWEKWALLPFAWADEDQKFEEVASMQTRLTHPLRVQVRDERDTRVRIPDEIYTDPTKTGWEEMEK